MARVPLQSIPWARRLKLRHLEVFLALYETGSITAAAAELHMTQPAMSHWLADVEALVGCPLFLRKRRLEPTPAGEVLRMHAERMLGDVQRVHAELDAVQSGLQGRLQVGTTVPPVLLPRAIARLQEKMPGVYVAVVESPLAELLERLAKREIDAVIGALTAQVFREGFTTEVLMRDVVQVVAREDHPFLAAPSPAWQETCDYPWIMPPAGSVMRGRLDEAFAEQGLTPPRPSVEASSSIRVQLLLTGGRDYLSVLTGSEVQLFRGLGRIRGVTLDPPITFPDIGVIWLPNGASPLVSHLLAALHAESTRA
jgi:DNA-binding transcriptional LysR family regulator